MSKPRHLDFPLEQIAESCDRLVKQGNFFLQKWTCRGCGQRLLANNINMLVDNGHCEHCNHVTDLRQHGCNFMLIAPGCPITLQELEAALDLAKPGIH